MLMYEQTYRVVPFVKKVAAPVELDVTRHTEVKHEDRAVLELAARRVNVVVRITYTNRDVYGISLTGPAKVVQQVGYMFSTPKFATRFAWKQGGIA